jgi:4-hydroxyphenylpyruvate dioxygenase
MRSKGYIETRGISFLEFSGPRPELLIALFDQMGFSRIGQHELKHISVYAQGNIRFVNNPTNGGNAEIFRSVHERGICAIGIKVDDSLEAFDRALVLGAAPASRTDYDIPAICGVGASLLYLVDARREKQLFKTLNCDPAPKFSDVGLINIDHLTHNLRPGGIERWLSFYEKIFGFQSVERFDISGKQTGLISEVVVSPSGEIKIPLNETKDEKSQIAEFITTYNGEGVQHVALSCSDIYHSVNRLRENGIQFQETLDAYYDLVERRMPGHNESLSQLKELQILIDGGPYEGGGTLLQIFAKESIGPIFFEYIQRKGNNGFGKGNFQALFDSIELDQQRRGVLAART